MLISIAVEIFFLDVLTILSIQMPKKCLLCKLFFRRDLTQEFIGLIFNKHRTYIGKILKEWGGRWGKGGEQCNTIDITFGNFLASEEPARSKEVGVTNSVVADGTETPPLRRTETIQQPMPWLMVPRMIGQPAALSLFLQPVE